MTRIIIADDHPFLCSGVKAVLNAAGMDVVATAGDGDLALEQIARHDPDVVILDVAMPGRDGIATLAAMREAGDQRPVILLTAHIDDRALVSAIKAKVDGIVFKQSDSGSLVDAVRLVASGERAISASLIERALDASIAQPRFSQLDALTRREKEIASAVTLGLRNRDIADRLGMTEGSIKVYLHRIYGKLNVENRTGLAMLMREAGAVPTPVTA